MEINAIHLAGIVGVVLVIGVVRFGWRKGASILSDIRTHLLTLHGFAIAIIWWCVCSGAFASYIVFQSKVMGNEPGSVTVSSKK